MEKTENPILLFKKWYGQELKLSKEQIPSAVCLSTVGIDHFPNARFVSLKEIIDGSFIITGPLDSRKGIEIKNNNKVSLTFWWTATERQIRIQGVATKISEELAETYFKTRSRASQAVSLLCKQGIEVDDVTVLKNKVLDKVAQGEPIDRPKSWGGFAIAPVRIEFMEFHKTRFHDRKLYEFENNTWKVKQLQP